MDATDTDSAIDPLLDAERQGLNSLVEKSQSYINLQTDNESLGLPPNFCENDPDYSSDSSWKTERQKTGEKRNKCKKLQGRGTNRPKRCLPKSNVQMTKKNEKNRLLESCLKEACESKSERESELERLLQETHDINSKLKKNIGFLLVLISVMVIVPLSIGLHFTFKGHEVNLLELRMILVGKTGAGKSASGNTILSEEAFRVEASPASVTANCKMKNKILDGKNITIIDTPGVMDTWLLSNQKAHHAHDCISMYSPKPHVFLLVIRLGRFTLEESNAVKWIQENFGKEAVNFTMILFTGGDLLEGKPVDKFISNSYDLHNLVDTCHGRYHVFNNYDQSNHTQVRELLIKVNVMLHLNMGYSYMKERSDWTSKEMAIRQEEEMKRKSMEEDMQMEERRKMNEMARQLRDEQYENKNLKTELNHEHHISFWFKVSTGLLVLTLIILICTKI